MRSSFNVMNKFFFSLIKVNFCGIGDRQSAMLLFNSHGHTLKEVKSWFLPNIHVRHLIKFPKGNGIKFFLKKQKKTNAIHTVGAILVFKRNIATSLWSWEVFFVVLYSSVWNRLRLNNYFAISRKICYFSWNYAS